MEREQRQKANRKYERGRRNIQSLHAASDREFTSANDAKYGSMPWGQFYHYVAMELAPHATRQQMEDAITKALDNTAAQEAGCAAARQKLFPTEAL